MADNAVFSEIDAYIDGLFCAEDDVLSLASETMAEAGLPEIQVSPGQGKFLYLLAKLAGARRILEIGTLGAYSTIWLARALPSGGQVTTIEYDPHHAGVAQRNLQRAGLSGCVDLRIGAALDVLPTISEGPDEPFDLVFLDADKPNYTAYLEWSLRLTRPGALILADNVVRAGAVLSTDDADASAKGAAAFNQALARDDRLEAVILQQVGIKGHDGLAVARVRD